MSDFDKERLNRLEERLAEVLAKVDHHEVLLQQLTGRVARQDQLLSRLLNLLGLTPTEMEAETADSPKPHSLLLLMRRALN